MDIKNGYPIMRSSLVVGSYNSYLKGLPLSRICEALSNVKESDKVDKEEHKKVCQVNKILESFKSTDTGKSEKFVAAVIGLVNYCFRRAEMSNLRRHDFRENRYSHFFI